MKWGDELLTSGVSVVTAIIGLAILAVILSAKSQTSQTITSAGNVFSNLLNKAVLNG